MGKKIEDSWGIRGYSCRRPLPRFALQASLFLTESRVHGGFLQDGSQTGQAEGERATECIRAVMLQACSSLSGLYHVILRKKLFHEFKELQIK